MEPLPRVELFTKACCPLCDQAKEAVENARARLAFHFEVVDIEGDPLLYERYRELIPVLAVNGREVFYGKVSAHRLLEILKATPGMAPPSLSRRYERFLTRLKALLKRGSREDQNALKGIERETPLDVPE